MSFKCQKISKSLIIFRRTLSSRARSDFYQNRNNSTPTASNSINNDDFDQRDEKKRPSSQDSQKSRIIQKDGEYLSKEKNRNLTFDNYVAENVQRARRSILVRFSVRSPNHYNEMYSEICKQLRSYDISVLPPFGPSCSSIAPIVNSPDGMRTFFLLDATSRESLDRLIFQHARSAKTDHRILPCRTRILHFTGAVNGEKSNSSRKLEKVVPGTDTFTLNKALRECHWVDEQMRVLVDETILTESGTNLRFFVASLIEDMFRGVFPNSICMPFGSTTNGFGHSKSDLDLDFSAEDSSIAQNARSDWLCAFRTKDDDVRKNTQHMVELMGRMLRTCLPYVTDVSRIVNARVPIVKFNHDAGGFGCDITVDNVTGCTFSKILWIYSRVDSRIRPLVFTIRYWAAALRITRDGPGDFFTNFQLLCLVVHFLQTRVSGPALPSIRTLRRLASSSEQNGIIGDPERLLLFLRTETQKGRPSLSDEAKVGQESLGDLLRDFFDYYGRHFAFERLGISLESGSVVEKNDFSQPVFIDNPLEANHNIAKNVTEKELHRFRSFAKMAVKMMESAELMERKSSEKRESWGLLVLFDRDSYEKLVSEQVANDWTSASQSGVLLIDDVEIDIQKKTSEKTENLDAKSSTEL